MPQAPLTTGEYGDSVAQLHSALIRLGFRLPDSEIRRKFFGPATREAVLQLQREHALPISGGFDERTAAAATAELTAQNLEPSPLVTVSSAASVQVAATSPVGAPGAGTRTDRGGDNDSSGGGVGRAAADRAGVIVTPPRTSMPTIGALTHTQSTSGNGGAQLPRLVIDDPGPVYLGVAFTISGYIDSDLPLGSKTYQVIATVVQVSTSTTVFTSKPVPTGHGTGDWSVSVPPGVIPATGQYQIRADQYTSGVPGLDEAKPVNFQVQLDVPTLTIISPAQVSGKTTVSQISNTLTVSVATKGSIVTAVTFSLDGGTFQGMSPGTQWSGTLVLLPRLTNAAGDTHTLTVRATTAYAQATASMQILARDNTPPAIGFHPDDGQQVPGTLSAAPVTVQAEISDADGVDLSSGIATVTMTTGTQTATLTSPPWTATLQLAPQDPAAQAITVTATDNAGNTASVTHHVIVALPTFHDLSEQSYLGDLADFACRRVTARPDGAATITRMHLEEAFHQQFSAIINAPPGTAGQQVRTLRVVINALLGYLTPRAQAPVAWWPLNDQTSLSGSNPMVLDATGGGNDGTIIEAAGAGWVSGRQAGVKALYLDGTHACVEVATPTQGVAPFTVSDQVTVAAWILPDSGAGDGVIAGRESQYLLGRMADGTIRWALATQALGLQWVKTSAVVPAGTWTHVAMTYDGAQVRTFVNGVLQHSAAATGPVGTTDTTKTNFRIGGRQLTDPHDSSFFQGAISDVQVADQAFTPWDIACLHTAPTDQDETWIDDALPAGAIPTPAEDGWNWISANPRPYRGTTCHQSALIAGEHQHYVTMPGQCYLVNRGDTLFTYVYLDPANPPTEVMLQWYDPLAGWDHRAFWGEDQIAWGNAGTASRCHVSDLPSTGQWVRLEVPARAVGLEQAAVQGFAFTLFNGRAAWDYTGKTGWSSALPASGYTAAAYRALLLAIGTSEEEIRLARSASPQAREALAARLGFKLTPRQSPTDADELDQLLLAPGSVQDSDLETLFGLVSPLRPVLTTLATASLLSQWQATMLRSNWKNDDAGNGATDFGTVPIIDPDLVTVTDFVSTSRYAPTGSAPTAYQLWTDRTNWITGPNGPMAALQAARQGQPNDNAALANVIKTGLPGLPTGADFGTLETLLAGGSKIDGPLSQAHLTMPGFHRLSQLKALAAAGPLEPFEWEDVFAILVQVAKVAQYPAWRDAESQDSKIQLTPDVFNIPVPGTAATLLPWRASPSARQDCEERLSARAAQLTALQQGLTAAAAAAEEASFPILRDALVSATGYGQNLDTLPDELTTLLLIDAGSSSSLTTTPLDQAIETMQSALLGIETHSIETANPDLPPSPAADWALIPSESSSDMEKEWAWMGSYPTWQAAMSTFFYPETLMAPTLLTQASPGDTPLPSTLTPTAAFTTWMTTTLPNDIKLNGPLTPDGAQHLAGQLLTGLRSLFPNVTFPPATLTLTLPDANGVARALTDADLDTFAGDQHALLPTPGPTNSFVDLHIWAREAFLLAPLHLALSLQQVGQYQAALDWLRTIFAYYRAHTGQADSRLIFQGFAYEQPPTGQQPDPIIRPTFWLRDNDLNPHVIATTRPHTPMHLRYVMYTTAKCLLDYADSLFTHDTAETRPQARLLYLQALNVLGSTELAADDTLPPLPLRDSLTGRASNNLRKLRLGLNIAGISRPLDQGTGLAGVPPPSPYRYSTLIARAQQVLATATEVEQRYLAALQAQDNEQYTLNQAQADLGIATQHATVMQDQATIATEQITVTQKQQARAQTQIDTYGQWIAQGPNDAEQAMLNDYKGEADARNWQTGLQAAASAASAAAQGCSFLAAGQSFGASNALNFVSAGLDLAAGGAGIMANNAQYHAQVNAFNGSLERQMDNWSLNQSLATSDRDIASQQVTIATNQANVADAEATIASQQATDAQAKVTFLLTKFTNVNLYTWMQGVLGDVYRTQLQQATGYALLAQQQLAFERQEASPGYVKTNYVIDPASDITGSARTSGLTGAERLLADLSQLDDYAFDTEKRKLQLTHIISLAQLAPVDFQRFRQTGTLSFLTPMPVFDQVFPGHYLRLIRQVSVSVVAIVPTTQGIRATLTSGGVSRVVIPGDSGFTTVQIARAPETIALTGAVMSNGLFQLDAQPNLMLPFEGCGVDMAWLLQLPKAANAFDYRSIADVLVTIEYTAFSSPDYASRVIRSLGTRASNTVSFSLTNDFPDVKYELLAQAQADPPPAALTAQVSLSAQDFPPNLTNLDVENITLMVIRKGTAPLSVTVTLARNGTSPAPASTVADIVSTRNASGAAWRGFTGPGNNPAGTWTLAFQNNPPASSAIDAFTSGDIQDVVLVLGYGGDLPPWPLP
jgi:hypothetical protein